MSVFKWPEETRKAINELIGKLNQLDQDAHNDGTGLQDRWAHLAEQARALFEHKISKRLSDVENVLDDDWPEMDDFQDGQSNWPLCEAMPGPLWDGTEQGFEEYSGDEDEDEVVDGIAGELAVSLGELTDPATLKLSSRNRRALEKYAKVLRARLELVEGMLAE